MASLRIVRQIAVCVFVVDAIGIVVGFYGSQWLVFLLKTYAKTEFSWVQVKVL
jgi:hypothetical protein